MRAVVDNKLYSRGPDGRWSTFEHPDWGEVRDLAVENGRVWIAGAKGLVVTRDEGANWNFVLVSSNGFAFDDVMSLSAAGSVVWASACNQQKDGLHCALVRHRDDKVEVFEHPDKQARVLATTTLVAQPDGSVLVWLASAQGTLVQGSRALRFDGQTWTPLPLPTNETEMSGLPPASGNLLWASGRHGLYRREADGSWSKPNELPQSGTLGELLGVAETSAGTWLLTGFRLHLWHEGRWTFWTAPLGGVSLEKTEPASSDDASFVATGRVLKAGVEPVLAKSEVQTGPKSGWKPKTKLDGVPVFELLDRGGELPEGDSTSDWWAYREEIAPEARVTLVGIYENHGGKTPALQAINSPQRMAPLSAPLEVEEDALVTLEAKPVLKKTYARQNQLDLVFEPVSAPRVQSVAKSRERVERFHSAHRKQLSPKREHPEKPKWYVQYDGGRKTLLFTSALGGFYQDFLNYETTLDGQLLAVYHSEFLRGE